MITTNKYFRFGFKLLFGLAVFSFVGWKVYQMIQNGSYKGPFETQNVWFLAGFALLLMCLNWSVEAMKWKSLMQTLEAISFQRALAGVLAGISTGLITPNRLGNFIGRTQLLNSDLRTKATMLTFLSNLSQFVPSVFFGCISVIFVIENANSGQYLYVVMFGILLLLLALGLYINPKWANQKPINYLFSHKIKAAIAFVQETRLILKLKVLVLSSLRYFIFVTQYVLLLMLFKQDYDLVLLFAHVSLVYLLMTIIPGLLFGKLFVREAAALLILGQLGIPDLVILITGFLIWLINIAVPSLLGTIVLLQKK